MNKTIKRNVVVSAILAIMLCVSLIAGATFALFTSESKVNIAVSSGKVDVKAEITNFKATHPDTISYEEQKATGEYKEGFYQGTAEYDEKTNEITLSNMVAGDKVTFDIVVTNYSTVDVKFKTTYTISGDEELQSALNIIVGDSIGWLPLSAASKEGDIVETLNCYVELPCNAGNTAQNKSCTISFMVEAVQGNADVKIDDSVTQIHNADEFMAFANAVNAGTSYAGKTVILCNDIDLTGKNFKGIGDKHPSYGAFSGTFDGFGHKITGINFANACPDYDEDGNLTNGCIDSCNTYPFAYCAAGLFNQTSGATIKNVTVDGAKISGVHYTAGIVAYDVTSPSTIENCRVINSEITSKVLTVNGETDGGDKVGGIVGYTWNGTKVNNCSVSNTTITGYRDLAAIVGYANDNVTVTNCTIGENVIVKVDRSNNYKNYKTAEDYDAGNFVGQADDVTDVTTGNTGKATILNADWYVTNQEELVAAGEKGGEIALMNDIAITGEWTPIKIDTGSGYMPIGDYIVIDGNNHSISGLTTSFVGSMAARDYN